MWVDAVVLAAGKALRFGLPKFLLPAGPGHTLLTRVLETALNTVQGRVVVVLGREAKLARKNLVLWLMTQGNAGSRVVTVFNPLFEQGQSTSLKAGVRTQQGSQGFLVFLADMPLLDKDKLEQLLQKIEESPQALAVTASEMGQIRPPVYLTSRLFDEIQQLGGDQGARKILQQRPTEIELVEWGPGDWFTDIDTWETYQEVALKQSWASEPFEPLEYPPTLQDLSQWFSQHSKQPDALELLRRAVLTLLAQARG